MASPDLLEGRDFDSKVLDLLSNPQLMEKKKAQLVGALQPPTASAGTREVQVVTGHILPTTPLEQGGFQRGAFIFEKNINAVATWTEYHKSR